jgi:hypothetical protein
VIGKIEQPWFYQYQAVKGGRSDLVLVSISTSLGGEYCIVFVLVVAASRSVLCRRWCQICKCVREVKGPYTVLSVEAVVQRPFNPLRIESCLLFFYDGQSKTDAALASCKPLGNSMYASKRELMSIQR